jgi:hypothetical protein
MPHERQKGMKMEVPIKEIRRLAEWIRAEDNLCMTMEDALNQVEQWLADNSMVRIWAYYPCLVPDRDEEIEAIFEAHGGMWNGPGYQLEMCQRDYVASVPVERAKACIAALKRAGFRVD